AYGGWTFWLNTFYPDIRPLGIALPPYEVPPDHLDRRRDDCGGTDCQAHGMFLLSSSGLRQRRHLGARPQGGSLSVATDSAMLQVCNGQAMDQRSGGSVVGA